MNLRKRLYLGLLPLLLLVVVTGACAILVCRHLANAFEHDLVNGYRVSAAYGRMRGAATRMNDALSGAEHGDMAGARGAFDRERTAFSRELMAQEQDAAGTPRADYTGAVDAAFEAFAGRGAAIVSSGGSNSLSSLRDDAAALFPVLSAIDRLEKHDYDEAQAAAARASHLSSATVGAMVGVMAVAFALSLLLARHLASSFRLVDDAKNNLVGTVSHELKTPLTSLRMAVYLLLERNFGTLTGGQRELLETARDSADRLLRILNDLLDLVRLESGVARLEKVPVPVGRLLDDMAREIRPIADANAQTVEVRVDTPIDAVSVDPDRIRHVFINLLSNAAKYSPEGSVITLYAAPGDPGYLRFGVRDQGPGVPQESLGRIFDKFYRVPGVTRKGAGLGLAIAREIVLAHGGAIACSAAPGGGSDFHFLLPAGGTAPAKAPAEAPVGRPCEAPKANERRPEGASAGALAGAVPSLTCAARAG
jgi:signal transduction histidine kinase